MMGKLVGVGLAGLTQLGIWVGSAAVIVSIIALQIDLSAAIGTLPSISPADVFLFPRVFLARIFYLRLNIRAHRIDGDDRAGGRAIRVSADNAHAHRFLF
jgi:hypothetical protein